MTAATRRQTAVRVMTAERMVAGEATLKRLRASYASTKQRLAMHEAIRRPIPASKRRWLS